MTTIKLDITRVPVLKTKHFKKQAEFINTINPGSYGSNEYDQLELNLSTMMDYLKYGGKITVAMLRQMAGKKIEARDHFFGWDIDVLSQLKISDDETIEFPLIFCKQLMEPNADIFSYKRLNTISVKNAHVDKETIARGEAYLNDMLELGIFNHAFVDDVLNLNKQEEPSMNKGQGVVYINYVDDKISSGMNGHAVNIFFDVYDFDIDKRSKSAYIDIQNENYSKITLIPLRNIGLIEFFPKKADFVKAYPVVKKFEEGE